MGYKMEFDIDLMIPNKSLSLSQGAICSMGWQSSGDEGSFTNAILQALAKEYKFSMDTPYEELSQKAQDVICYGTDGKKVEVHYEGQRGKGVYPIAFEGLLKNMERKYRETVQISLNRI